MKLRNKAGIPILIVSDCFLYQSINVVIMKYFLRTSIHPDVFISSYSDLETYSVLYPRKKKLLSSSLTMCLFISYLTNGLFKAHSICKVTVGLNGRFNAVLGSVSNCIAYLVYIVYQDYSY